MTAGQKTRALLLYAVLAAAAAAFALTWAESGRATVLDHAFRPQGWAFPILVSGAFFVLAIAGILVAKADAARSGARPGTVLRAGLADALPLLALALAPLCLEGYVTRQDLRARLLMLAALAATAAVFLRWSRLGRLGLGPLPRLGRLFDRFDALPRRRKAVTLFLAAFLVYNAATLALVLQGVTFSGDEPNYLLSTHSLLHDRDINLANNYADRDYFHFYDREENPRLRLGIYGRYGKGGDSEIYPINLPGISVLIVPWYALAGLFKGQALTFLIKGSLSVWAALLGVQVYLFARDRWARGRAALGLWAAFGFTAPILFYAVHLYPEAPVAFVFLLVYRRISSDRPLRTAERWALAAALGLPIWFGLKYGLIVWPLGLVAAWRLATTHRERWRALTFLAPAAVSQVLFALFTFKLYGTVSPLAIYEGVMSADQMRAYRAMVASIPLHDRLTAFFDYFLDQRDGLLLYSPFYLAAFAGFVEMWRRNRREFLSLLFVAAPFLLNYAFLTHRQGFSPQGRVLASVSWIGVIAAGYALTAALRPGVRAAIRATAALSVGIAAVLLFHPAFLYQPTTHEFVERPGDLFVWLSNAKVFLPPFLPSFIKVDNTGYWPDYAWVLALVAAIVAYALWGTRRTTELPGTGAVDSEAAARDRRGGRRRDLAIAALLLAAGIPLGVLYPLDTLYPTTATEPASGWPVAYSTMPMGRGVIVKPGGDLYFHVPKTYRVVFSSPKPLDKIRMAYGPEQAGAGDYSLRARFFDLALLEDRISGARKELTFEPPAAVRRRNLYVYEISLDLRHLSSENMQLNPFYFSIAPVR